MKGEAQREEEVELHIVRAEEGGRLYAKVTRRLEKLKTVRALKNQHSSTC